LGWNFGLFSVGLRCFAFAIRSVYLSRGYRAAEKTILRVFWTLRIGQQLKRHAFLMHHSSGPGDITL